MKVRSTAFVPLISAYFLAALLPATLAAQCPVGSLPNQVSTLGSIDWTAISCPANSPSNAACRRFENLDCGSSGPNGASSGTIRVLEPQGGGRAEATVIMLTGGRSVEYWGNKFGFPAIDTMQNLRSHGYRTIEVAFDEDFAWSTSELGEAVGALNLACRGQTLFADIKASVMAVDPGSKFCGTGNSGGGALLSFVVSHYDDTLFDNIVPTAGPTMSRVDFGCEPEVQNLFSYNCGNRAQMDQTIGILSDRAGLPANPPCDVAFFPGPCGQANLECAGIFQEMSLATTGGNVSPQTIVSIVLGGLDNTSANPQAEEYAAEIGVMTIPVPTAEHNLPASADGAAEIEAQLLANCFAPAR